MYRKELAWLEEEEGKEALVFTRLVGLQNERTSREDQSTGNHGEYNKSPDRRAS